MPVGNAFAIGPPMSCLAVALFRSSAKRFACGLAAGFGLFTATAWAGVPTVSLAWLAGPEPDVAGYKIYIGTNSHDYFCTLDVGNTTAAAVELPEYDTPYFFAATVYTAAGMESDFSEETSYIVSSAPGSGGGGSNTNTNSTVVYQPPTLSPIAGISINGTAGAQVVNFSGVTTGSGSAVTVTAISSDPSLIPNPAVNYTSPNGGGSLTLAPAANTSGMATITVTVNNGQPQNNLATQTFTVTVTKVYQAPTLNAIGNVSIAENASLQTVNFAGVTTGSGSSVSVTASSSNPSLIPNPTVTYTSPNSGGSLKFSPVANASGTATITVTVNNGQSQNNLATRTFTVNVTPVNQAPTLNAITNLTLNYNSAAQTVALGGISSGAADEVQTLTVKAVSSNTKVIPTPLVSYSSPSATGSLTVKPVSGASGSAVITVTVSDGSAANSVVTRTFTVTVKTRSASTSTTTTPTGTSSAPKLASSPKSQVVLKGKNASFKVSATGSGTLKYQWKRNGVNITGGTKATLSLSNCQDKNAGNYTVTVSNTKGSVTSTPAALIVSTTPAALLASAGRTNNQFAFDVVGVSGAKYIVQCSTDMVNWTPVSTNTAPFSFTDASTEAVPGKFFRTVYKP